MPELSLITLKASIKSCLGLFLTLLIVGCGSAVEHSTFQSGDFLSPDQPVSFGRFEVLVDPVEVSLTINPLSPDYIAKNPLTGLQGGSQTLGMTTVTDQIIFGAGWNAEVFDPNSLTIHLNISLNQNPVIAGVGTCIGHSLTNQWPVDLSMEFTNMSDPNVSFINGAVTNAVEFGTVGSDKDDSNGICRPWAMQNTTMAYYTFHLNFVADSIANSQPKSFIQWSDFTRFTYGGSGRDIDIIGNGFTDDGQVQVFVGNGKVSTLDSTSNTLVEFNVSQAYTAGFLNVHSGATVIPGPYITQPSTVTVTDLRLPDGFETRTSSMYSFFWNGISALQANGCPSSFDDSQVERNFLLGTTTTSYHTWDVGFTGIARFMIAFDYNQSGSLDSGDYTFTSSVNDTINVGEFNTFTGGIMANQITGNCGLAY